MKLSPAKPPVELLAQETDIVSFPGPPTRPGIRSSDELGPEDGGPEPSGRIHQVPPYVESAARLPSSMEWRLGSPGSRPVDEEGCASPGARAGEARTPLGLSAALEGMTLAIVSAIHRRAARPRRCALAILGSVFLRTRSVDHVFLAADGISKGTERCERSG